MNTNTNTKYIISIILITLIVGLVIQFNSVNYTIIIRNKTESDINVLIVKDENGNTLASLPTIRKNSTKTIKLDNKKESQEIFLGYYYAENTSYESFQISNLNNKKKFINVSINALYDNGKMDMKVK